MIELVDVQAYKCSICGWTWFNRKDGIKPKRCPRRSCRKYATCQPVAKAAVPAQMADKTRPKPLKPSEQLRAMREAMYKP